MAVARTRKKKKGSLMVAIGNVLISLTIFINFVADLSRRDEFQVLKSNYGPGSVKSYGV